MTAAHGDKTIRGQRAKSTPALNSSNPPTGSVQDIHRTPPHSVEAEQGVPVANNATPQFSPSELRQLLRIALHGRKKFLRKLQTPHGRIFWEIEQEIGRIDDQIQTLCQ